MTESFEFCKFSFIFTATVLIKLIPVYFSLLIVILIAESECNFPFNEDLKNVSREWWMPQTTFYTMPHPDVDFPPLISLIKYI